MNKSVPRFLEIPRMEFRKTLRSYELVETQPISKILPHLYLGNRDNSSDVDDLRDLGITHILNVTPKSTEVFGFVNKQLPCLDNINENLQRYFDDSYDFIENTRTNGARVLVFCEAGVSRSPTVVVAYVMRHLQKSMEDAYAFVKDKRPIISPNMNFMIQLYDLGKNINAEYKIDDSF